VVNYNPDVNEIALKVPIISNQPTLITYHLLSYVIKVFDDIKFLLFSHNHAKILINPPVFALLYAAQNIVANND